MNYQNITAEVLKLQVDHIEREKALQDHCPHLKPNHNTALAGQKLGNGHYFYICAYCHKEYDENTIPEFLKPEHKYVGGYIEVRELSPEETKQWDEELSKYYFSREHRAEMSAEDLAELIIQAEKINKRVEKAIREE